VPVFSAAAGGPASRPSSDRAASHSAGRPASAAWARRDPARWRSVADSDGARPRAIPSGPTATPPWGTGSVL
jgi:hypothetical protein